MIIVTGGDGFIGRQVCAALKADGYAVTSFDQATGCDVRDPDVCLEVIHDADTVVHLAGILGTAELFDDVHAAIDVNITGTTNVLDACRSTGASFVGVSMPDPFPSIYTATKVAAKRLASAYHHAHGIPTCHIRAFNAYGPGQAHGPGHPRKIIPALACEGWAGLPLQIWGDGTQGVDLIHVDDVADIFVDAINVGDDSTIDAGSGWLMTVNEVAEIVLSVTGSPAGVEHLPMRRGEIPTMIRSTGEGWELLTRPRYFATGPPLEQLAATIEAYRTHPTVHQLRVPAA